MYKKTVIVNLQQGLHARPASEFVQKARQYSSRLSIEKAEKSVDAKSILGLMGLAVSKGTEITVRGDGVDEVAAVDNLCEFLTQPE